MAGGYHQVLNSLTDDSSILLQPATTRWAWLTILRNARNGKIERLTIGTLALMAHITVEEAAEALRCFTSPDPYSSSAVDDGVRLRLIPEKGNTYELVTWELQKERINRANAAIRQERYEKRQSMTQPDAALTKANVLVDSKTKTKTEETEESKALVGSAEPIDAAPAPQSLFPIEPPAPRRAKATPRLKLDVAAFERFYDAYPRHDAKGAAMKAFPKAVEKSGDVEKIVVAARRYAEQVLRDRIEKNFIPLPATWLNAQRWLDEGVKAKPRGNFDSRGRKYNPETGVFEVVKEGAE